jgi:hypothetical protein
MSGARLSHAQVTELRAIASAGYRPTVLGTPSRRVLVARGLVLAVDGHPPTYSVTDAGRAALARGTGGAA